MLTPAQRSMRARTAAYELHKKYDSDAIARRAREGFEKKFLDEVDPDRVLPEGERLRRAAAARKAYFTRLALASSRARAARKAVA